MYQDIVKPETKCDSGFHSPLWTIKTSEDQQGTSYPMLAIFLDEECIESHFKTDYKLSCNHLDLEQNAIASYK